MEFGVFAEKLKLTALSSLYNGWTFDSFGNGQTWSFVDFKRLISMVYIFLLNDTKDFACNKSHIKNCECTHQHYILEWNTPLVPIKERCPKVSIVDSSICSPCRFFPGRDISLCAEYHYATLLIVTIMLSKPVSERENNDELQKKYEALCAFTEWLLDQCNYDYWTKTLAKKHPVVFLDYFLQNPLSKERSKAYFDRAHQTRDRVSPLLHDFVKRVNAKLRATYYAGVIYFN